MLHEPWLGVRAAQRLCVTRDLRRRYDDVAQRVRADRRRARPTHALRLEAERDSLGGEDELVGDAQSAAIPRAPPNGSDRRTVHGALTLSVICVTRVLTP